MSIFVSFVLILVSYLIGAIPTGYWFSKFFFNVDITQLGSGNIGATNIGRVLGKKYFALIFFIDFLKAFLTLYFLAKLLDASQSLLIFSAIALLTGNAHSIFLNFSGGKGVATTVGILAFLFPIKLLIVFVCLWVFGLVVVQRPFIASILAIYSFCFIYYFFSLTYELSLFYFLIFSCIWTTTRHWKNIKQFFQA